MKKVLIIEDDVSWQKLLSNYAEDVGADVKCVVSAGQAIEMIDKWHPDMLILDMLLAGETGVALLNEIKSYTDLAKLPVLICSSVAFQNNELAPFQVAGVFNKSTMFPDDIKSSIKEVLYGAE